MKSLRVSKVGGLVATVAVGLGIAAIVVALRPAKPGARTRRARKIVATLRAMPASPLWLGGNEEARVDSETTPPADVLTPTEGATVKVTMPGRSTQPLHIEDTKTKLGIDIQLRDVFNVAAQSGDGYFVYPHAHASGGTVLHRELEDGAEDFISFETRPRAPEVVFDVALKGVSSVRLVEETFELLDADGAPRLRAAPPFIVGADGERADATVVVENCKADTDPAAPWGRDLTPPGSDSCTLRIRWDDEKVRYPAVLDPRWQSTSNNMTSLRQDFTATMMSTGKVLAVGGRTSGTSTTGLSTAEIFDPATKTWATTASLTGTNSGRYLHTAVQLGSTSSSTTTGRVFVAGGTTGGQSLNTAQLYSPTLGTWLAATNLNVARHSNTATLLSNGNVLLAGGLSGTTVQNTAAVYNPSSGGGTHTATGPMPKAVNFHSATLLRVSGNTTLNNKVIVVGGSSGTASLPNVQLFDGTSTWTSLTALTSPREGHTATALANGNVLVTGGRSTSATPNTLNTTILFNAASSSGSWSSAGTLNAARQLHTATLLPSAVVENGQVLVAGGSSGSGGALGSAELWSGTTNWTITSSLPSGQQGQTATLLNNNLVLLAGGSNGSATVATSALFDGSFALQCTSNSQCATGFCANGFCCDSACNGGCGACNLAGKVGTCSAMASGSVCRAQTGACDVAETCDGTSLTCPTDAVAPLGTVCRPQAGSCDVAETCNGTAKSCPADTFVASGTVCRASAGPCDVAEVCTGSSAACPADSFASSVVICRPSAGACDIAETCTGTSSACPPDELASSTTVCGLPIDSAGLAATCTGTSASCPVSVAEEILGFESTKGWSFTTTAGTIIGLNPINTQGASSLEIAAQNYAPLVSAPMASLGPIGPTALLDIMLPAVQANPYWYGEVKLFVSSPSLGIYNVYLGDVGLTGLPLQQWQTLAFQIPAATVTALSTGTYSDLTFEIDINVPSTETGHYLLDNLRLSSQITPILLGIGQDENGVNKAVFSYQTTSTTTVNVPYGPANSLTDQNGQFIAAPAEFPPQWFSPTPQPFVLSLLTPSLTWTVDGVSVTASLSSPPLTTTTLPTGVVVATLPGNGTIVLDGGIDLSGAIVSSQVSTSVAPSTAAGRTSATFDVSGDGAASYQIPIWVPQGKANVQPELALAYNSFSEDSPIGFGWKLDGLSMISRCRQTYGRDGVAQGVTFTGSDKLCLDGERLVVVSGSYNQAGAEYRTEHDQFAKIVQTGADNLGPTGFLVYRADGTIDSYGNDQSASLAGYIPEQTSDLQGNLATVGGYSANDGNTPTVTYTNPARLAWGIGARANRYGTAIRYHYTPISQSAPDYGIEFRIDSITYNEAGAGGTGARTVRFNYATNTMNDARLSFVGGLPLTLNHLLTSIDVRGPAPRGDGLLKSYKLNQLDQVGSRALLNSVTECDGASICRVGTTFTYTAQDTTFTRIPTGVTANWQSVLLPGDENGDGKDDIITHDTTGSNVWEVLPSTGTGLGTPIQINYPLQAGLQTPFLSEGGRVADINNDGRADFFVPAFSNAGLHMEPILSTPSGYVNSDATNDYEILNLPPWAIPPNENHAAPIYVADFNGDGLPDFMRVTDSGIVGGLRVAQSGLTPPPSPADWSFRLNNAGLGMGPYGPYIYPSASGTLAFPVGRGTTVPASDVPAPQDSNSYTIDLDGAGASELLVNQGTRMQVLRNPNPGNLSGVPQLISLPKSFVPTSGTHGNHYIMMDVNGDGLADAVAVNNSGGDVSIALNTGVDFLPLVAVGLPVFDGLGASYEIDANGNPDAVDPGTRVIDFNQDGRSDLLLLDDGCNSYGTPGRQNPVVLEFSRGTPSLTQALTLSSGLGIPLFNDGCAGYPTSRNLDFNGDGLSDYVQMENQSGVTAAEIVVYVRNGQKPNLLSSVTDGVGHKIGIEYKPATDQSAVQGSGGCSYPQYCTPHGTTWVVSRHTYDQYPASAGPPLSTLPSRSYSHLYRGMRTDVSGFGYLGMDEHFVTDEATGHFFDSIYNHSPRTDLGTHLYPDLATPVAVYDQTPISATGETDTSLWQYTPSIVVENGGALVAVTPGTTTFTKTVTEPVGSLVPTGVVRSWTMTENYNSTYGYLNNSTYSCGGETETHTLSYDPDQPGPWLIGQIHRDVGTYSTPARSATNTPAESVTRTTEYHHDGNTGAVTAVIVEPDSADNNIYLSTSYGRNAFGQLETLREDKLDGTERAWGVTYEPTSGVYPLVITNPLHQTTRMYFHPGLDVLVGVQDANGLVTKRKYDGFGLLREEDRADGGQLTRTYDLVGSTSIPAGMFVTTDDQGRQEEETLDVNGNKIGVTSLDDKGQTIAEAFSYDPYGRLLYKTLPYATVGGYQPFDPPTSANSPTLPAIQYTYDERGRMTSQSAPPGLQTWQHVLNKTIRTVYTDTGTQEDDAIFDELDRMVQRVEKVGATSTTAAHDVVTNYVHGPFGVFRDVIDGFQNTTHVDYDVRGRRIDLQDPDSGTLKEVHDAFDTVVSKTDSTQRTVTTYPDLLGRTVRVDMSTGTNTYTWDSSANGIGEVGGTTSEDGINVSYSYNPLGVAGAGELADETWAIDGTSLAFDYSYDSLGRLQVLSYPAPLSGPRYSVQYKYTALSGELDSIFDPSQPSDVAPLYKVNSREPTRQVSTETYSDGVVTTSQYDPVRRFTTSIVSLAGDGTTLQNISYNYDRRGYMDRRIDTSDDGIPAVFELYTHDELGRLVDWEGGVAANEPSTNWDVTYGYDDIGNMLQRQETGPGGHAITSSVFTPGQGAGPHAVTTVTAGGVSSTYQYDSAGRQYAGPNRSVTFTDFNLPRSIDTSTGTYSFRYDAGDQRAVKKTPTEETIYIGSLFERRITNSGTTDVLYVAGEGGVVAQVSESEGLPPRIDFYHPDHLGSIDTTTTVGAPTQRKFDPFGVRIQPDSLIALPTPGAAPDAVITRGFAGEEEDDDLGLINMNGRIYDPTLARFLTPDPDVSRLWKSQSLNHYSYVENSPIMMTDPTGFDSDGGDDGGDGGDEPILGSHGDAASPSGEASATSGDADAGKPPSRKMSIKDGNGNPMASMNVPCQGDCGTTVTMERTGQGADDQNPGTTTPVDRGTSVPSRTIRIPKQDVIVIVGSKSYGTATGQRVPQPWVDRGSDEMTPVNKYGLPAKKGQSVHYLEPQTLKAFLGLRNAAANSGFDKEIFTIWGPTSAYRTQAQEDAKAARERKEYPDVKEARKYVAQGGTSEHFTGRTIDFVLSKSVANSSANIKAGAFKNLPAYLWLKANASSFGFNPYGVEPWHWSYSVK
jgi:RHS repeat-associated protein